MQASLLQRTLGVALKGNYWYCLNRSTVINYKLIPHSRKTTAVSLFRSLSLLVRKFCSMQSHFQLNEQMRCKLHTESNTQSQDDQLTVVDSVLDKVLQNDDMPSQGLLHPTDKQKIRDVILCLLDMRYSKSAIEKLLIDVPKLMSNDVERTKALFEFLTNYGFKQSKIVGIVIKYPEILSASQKNLIHRIEFLRSCGFTDYQLLGMIAKCPQVIELKPKMITACLSNLKVLFSDKQVLACISRNPSVLFDEWETTEYKFHYAHFAMGFHQNDIMATKLFTHSISHIHARHQFLQRAGLFIKPDNKGRCRIENPSLKAIMDPSDDDFAREVANMDVEDYHTFCKLLERENLPDIEKLQSF